MKNAAEVFRRADKLSFMPSSKEEDGAGFQEICGKAKILLRPNCRAWSRLLRSEDLRRIEMDPPHMSAKRASEGTARNVLHRPILRAAPNCLRVLGYFTTARIPVLLTCARGGGGRSQSSPIARSSWRTPKRSQA
jgi:hypothetical protein